MVKAKIKDMKNIFKNITIIILLVLSSFFIFIDNSQARDKGRGFLIPYDSSAYDIYSYPEGGESKFSIPYGFKVKFTVKNGKYFYIQSEDIIGNYECNFDVWFFTSDGEKIKKVNVKHLTESYEIPQNEKSNMSEYVEVVIFNNYKKISRNFNFVVASDKNSIHGELLKEKI